MVILAVIRFSVKSARRSFQGDDLFSSAANTYPKFAFMSFGMNDMGNYSGNADLFIEKYTKLIKEFKKLLQTREF